MYCCNKVKLVIDSWIYCWFSAFGEFIYFLVGIVCKEFYLLAY